MGGVAVSDRLRRTAPRPAWALRPRYRVRRGKLSAAPTARDRDRLRQQHLEALGWRFHRIWSTDWFMRREEEGSRALQAFEAAVAYADRLDVEGDAPASGEAPARPPVSGGASMESTRVSSRGPRPRVPRRQRIEEYDRGELEGLVRWIQSDGRLRTDDELLSEMVDELEFSYRGKRIEAAIRQAIARVRGRSP